MDKTTEARELRHPKEIAADIVKLHGEANLKFVPMNVKDALELMVEFAEAVAARYE